MNNVKVRVSSDGCEDVVFELGNGKYSHNMLSDLVRLECMHRNAAVKIRIKETGEILMADVEYESALLINGGECRLLSGDLYEIVEEVK